MVTHTKETLQTSSSPASCLWVCVGGSGTGTGFSQSILTCFS